MANDQYLPLHLYVAMELPLLEIKAGYAPDLKLLKIRFNREAVPWVQSPRVPEVLKLLNRSDRTKSLAHAHLRH